MRFLIAYLVAFFIIGPVTIANARGVPEKSGITKSAKLPPAPKTQPSAKPPKVGDKAKNLSVLPPWTMRKCPKLFFATFDKLGAKELKKADSACHLGQTSAKLLKAQVTDQTSVIKSLKGINATYQTEHKLDEKRIQDLMKQVKAEIEEKNKHKYKVNYGWLYISVGAALAAVGIAFGVGVWVSKEN